jgi:hypothetical protein
MEFKFDLMLSLEIFVEFIKHAFAHGDINMGIKQKPLSILKS